MLSTMQDFPLTVGMIFRHGRTVHGDSEVVTFEGETSRRASFAEVADRADRLAVGAAPPRHRRRRPGRHLHVEHPGAPRGVLRDPVHRRGAPHAQHPAVPRAARLHREPRRRPGRSSSTTTSCPLLARVAAELDDGRALHRGRRRRRVAAADAAPGAQVLRYDELLAAERPAGFEYPEIDERAAAAMCYTSGTTGNPKGVVYSHRSTFLHSIGVADRRGGRYNADDRVLPIVPMFHANAWGMPVRGVDGRRRPPHARAVPPGRAARAPRRPGAASRARARCPTIWTDLLHYAEDHDVDLSSVQRRPVRRRRPCRARSSSGSRTRFGVRIAPGLGHDRDQPARRGRAAAAAASSPARPRTSTGARCPGRIIPGVELRIVDDDGAVLPWDGEAVGEIQVRGPVGHRRRTTATPRPRSSTTAGCAPATSPASPPNGYIKITDRVEGRHQVGRRVDLVGRARRPPHGAPRRRRGRGDRGARPDVGRNARSRASCCKEGATSTLGRAARVPRAARRAAGSCPSGGRSSTRCPKTSVGKFDKKVLRAAVRRRRARRRGAARELATDRRPAMTPTLAASVFDRLGDDLWLLVPAFVFALLAGALIGRVLGVRRSFAASVALGHLRAGSSAWRSSLLIADRHATRASDGFGRNLFLFSLFGAMAAGVWIEFLARPGHRRCARRPGCSRCRTRCGRCGGAGGGCSATPRSRASRCATGSARRSGSGARTTRRGGRRPPPVRRLRLALEQCGGHVREARADPRRPAPISSRRTPSRELSLLQDHVRPADRDADRRDARGGARRAARRGVRRASTGSRSPRRRSARCTAPQLPDGSPVVVKVHRPGHRRVGRGRPVGARGARARSIETRTSWGAEYHVMDLVDEFSARLREELDFRIEARNARHDRGQPARRRRGSACPRSTRT